MAPFEGHHNPHHTFIPGKPHPNGILFTTSADENFFLHGLSPRFRLQTDFDPVLFREQEMYTLDESKFKKTHNDTCTNVLEVMQYPKGSVVVIDRGYGSLEIVQKLCENGVFCVAKCPASHPTFIFKGFLHTILFNQKPNKLGQAVYCVGKFPNSDFHYTALTVIAGRRGKTWIVDNFISSYHVPTPITFKKSVEETTNNKDGTSSSTTRVTFEPNRYLCLILIYLNLILL